MDENGRRAQWERHGYLIERQVLPLALTLAVRDEIIDRIRSDPPSAHQGDKSYFSGPDLNVHHETVPSASARNPEDRISRVFNCHTEGISRSLANDRHIVERVRELLGPDLVCFQSQFIFKNPGVIGQPWHQDSHYFPFDRQPQVTVWIPLSSVTIENGCLWVLPGSHRGGIFEHLPDSRKAANSGYLEITGLDASGEVPVVMEPGDVLYFHSYLAHRAADNVANYRRVAVVYHYATAGTKFLTPQAESTLKPVNRWIPISGH